MNSIMPFFVFMIQKVFAYITWQEKLLVFNHPYSPRAGVQVPAGTVDERENLETAVLREAYEETGLSNLVINQYLGKIQFQWPGKEHVAQRHFFHLICKDDAPPHRWWHKEEHPSEGDETSIQFELYWVNMPEEIPVLAPGHAKFLPQLMAHMEINQLPTGEPVTVTAVSPQRRSFNGRFISLHPLDPDQHAADLFEIGSGSPEKEAIWRYMGYGPFPNLEAHHALLAAQAQQKDPLFLTVINNDTNKAIGVVSFLNIVPTHGRIELGHIWYGLEAQNTKTNTETVYLMLCHVFEECHYRRAEWKCDSRNGRSRRAALRLGFQFEGIFRQHLIIKGFNRDTAWFSMLDSEWPAIKQNMEQWLYGETNQHSLAWLNQNK